MKKVGTLLLWGLIASILLISNCEIIDDVIDDDSESLEIEVTNILIGSEDVSIDIVNGGTMDLRDAEIWLFISSDRLIDRNDYYVGNYYITIASGSSSTFTLLLSNLDFSEVSQGDYYLGVYFDPALVGVDTLDISVWASIVTMVVGSQQEAVSDVEFLPVQGTFTSDQLVELVCATEGADIYYTTGSASPDTTSTLYTAPIPVAGDGTSLTISAIAVKEGMTDSSVVTGTFTIEYVVLEEVESPQFSPSAGTYTSDQTIALSCGTSGASIYYTTDGNSPYTFGILYTSAIPVAGDGTSLTISAIAVKEGMTDSSVVTAEYLIEYPDPQTAQPYFSPGSGSYNADQSVSINCLTTGAIIYYTTNGMEPTTLSSVYSSPITVAGHGTAMTIKAFAAKPGYTDSPTASASYTISYPQVATPLFSHDAGEHPEDISVSISSSTSGSTIYYTLDGNSPTTASDVYSSPVSMAGHGFAATLKAIAVKSGMLNSSVSSAAYSIDYNTSLVAHYPFNGNADDVSGRSPDGVVSGATLTTDRLGNANSAYYFSSAAASITVPKANFSHNSTVTVTGWIKSYLQGSRRAVICGDFSIIGINGYYIGMSININPSGSTNTASSPNLAANTWYHFAGTYDGQYIRIYVDSNLVGTVSHPGTIYQTSTNLVFSQSASGWTGLLDDIQIYDRVLTQQEIESVYDTGSVSW